VLRWEGGYVDHPNDPGGKTNKGVTQVVYDAWRRDLGQSPRSVRDSEDREVHDSYQQNYWRSARCDSLEVPLDVAQFDTAVNRGVGRAIRFLQAAVGTTVDGQFGPGTQRAVDTADANVAIVAYCNERERYYRRLVERNAKLEVFLKGWLNRLNALRARVGIPVAGASRSLGLGAAVKTMRIPDVGEDQDFDV